MKSDNTLSFDIAVTNEGSWGTLNKATGQRNFGQKHEAVSREKFEEEKKLLLRDAKGLFKMK